MSETWYEIDYARRIKPITADRHTDESVWISGRRRARVSSYGRGYYPTWQAAKDALLAAAETKVNQLRRQLEQANGELGNIKGLKP